VDVIVAPTYGGIAVTNLTGHPALTLPNGLRGADAPVVPSAPEYQSRGPGTPTSLTFLGNLYGEVKLVAFAKAYQDATEFHLQHPSSDSWLT
jgi:Asp-tRNA(Asn)/Glu-tRNA(Gln) amidotransferase A subunit family amidase